MLSGIYNSARLAKNYDKIKIDEVIPEFTAELQTPPSAFC